MTTDTDICNRALSAIGTRSTIASMQEKSNEAKQCALLYAPTRNSLMRAAHWDFARYPAYLTLLKAMPGTPENPTAGTVNWDPATQPAPPWLYEYAYPADCLLLRFITPQISTGATGGTPIFSTPSYIPVPAVNVRPQRFQIGSDLNQQGQNVKIILSNQSQAVGVYTRLITEPDLWDDLFQEAMVAALGVRLVIPLAGDKAMLKLQREAAVQAIMQARVSDGNEGFTIENWTPDWLAIRGVAGDYSTPISGCFTAWSGCSFLGI